MSSENSNDTRQPKQNIVAAINEGVSPSNWGMTSYHGQPLEQAPLNDAAPLGPNGEPHEGAVQRVNVSDTTGNPQSWFVEGRKDVYGRELIQIARPQESGEPARMTVDPAELRATNEALRARQVQVTPALGSVSVRGAGEVAHDEPFTPDPLDRPYTYDEIAGLRQDAQRGTWGPQPPVQQ